ncbi:hypothetical protein LJR090_000594 [Bosea sp. LjRoot90]|uniref:hypothetical protein n=1 Tax=Bosea sp. LjRoot90 TaxID=3342342 RepID=UPI003ECD132C
MSSMKFFVTAYALSVVVAVLFVLSLYFPLLLIVFTVVFLGFFFYAPTPLIYMTAIAPGFFLSRDMRDFRAGVILGIVGIVLVSAGPSLWGRWLAYRDAWPILAQDISGRLVAPPRRLEILSNSSGYGGPNDPLLNARCEEYCQTLLLNGEVDELRVTPIQEAYDSPRDRKGGAARFTITHSSVVYSYAKRWSCPKAFAQAEIALPATRLRALRGECIIATMGNAWLPSVRILVTRASDWLLLEKPAELGRSLIRFEVFGEGGSSTSPLARLTEMRASVPVFPLIYGAVSLSGSSMLGLLKTQAVLKSADLGLVLRETLGFKLRALETPPEELPLDTIERLLSSPGSDAFGPELKVFISAYLGSLQGKKDLAPTDVRMLERLITDPRVTEQARIFEVMQKFDLIGAAAIEAILDRLQRPAPESIGHEQNQLVWILIRVPLNRLKPYGERLLATAALSDQWHYAPLLQVVGRFGIDPTGLLQSRLSSGRSARRDSAITGVCAADEPWRGQLLPAVETIVEEYRGQPDRGNSELVVGIFTLGEQNATAAGVLASMIEADRRRVLHQVAGMRRRFPDGRCGTA